MESLILKKIDEVEYSCEIENTYSNLTKTARKIIKKAILEAGVFDERIICEKVCEIIVNKHTNDKGQLNDRALNYQTKRMGLSTTGDIKKAINSFLSSPHRLKQLLRDV